MASFLPPIGTWYQDAATGQLFEIVALDEKNRTIEVQYEDGDISEFDIESWGQLSLCQAEAPENANGGYSLPAYEDDCVNEAQYCAMAFANPLDSIEPDSFSGFDDLF